VHILAFVLADQTRRRRRGAFAKLRAALLAGPDRHQATLVKSAGRRSAKAVKASRASAVFSRSAKIWLSAPIWALMIAGLRISRLVAESEPAGCFASRAAIDAASA